VREGGECQNGEAQDEAEFHNLHPP
jgi:hypothetical protein